MKTKCQIHLLESDTYPALLFSKSGIEIFGYYTCAIRTPHIKKDMYVTSDDIINEGDWFLLGGIPQLANSKAKRNEIGIINWREVIGVYPGCVKIIATTDKSLNIPLISPISITDYVNACKETQSILTYCYVDFKIGCTEKESKIVNGYKNQREDVIGFVAEREVEYDFNYNPVVDNNFVTLTFIKDTQDDLVYNNAINHVKNTYCDLHLGIPYMLLGDVADLIKIITGKSVTMEELTIK